MIESLPDPRAGDRGGAGSHRPAENLADRRVIYANPAARELLRIQGEGATLVSAIRHPRVLEAVDESLFGNIHGEAAYETGGAQDRFWRVRTQPLAPAKDGARLALMVIRDETDSRRNERMRADFLANASHELRTPLASLTGFIETLRGHAKDDAVARERFLGVMAAQAGRMARLIDDLMSLSRIELNEHIAPDGRVDVVVAVLDVIDALTPLAAERGVKLKTRLAARGAAMIVGDRDQILQVAQNLIDNAVKYSPDGGCVEIEVAENISADTAIAPTRAGARRWPVAAQPGSGRRRAVRDAALHRLRARHRPRISAAPVGALLSGRGPEERRATGHGPRSGDRQTHHQPPSRRPGYRECGRSGDDLYRLPSPGCS